MQSDRHSVAIWDWEQLVDPVWAYAQESKKDFSLFLKVPRGFAKNDIKMQVFEDVLTITGRKNSMGVDDGPFASFSRSIKLPPTIAHGDVLAAWQSDSELQVSLPKKFGREPVAFNIPAESGSSSLPEQIERKLAGKHHSLNPEDHLMETETKLKMAEDRRKAMIDEDTQRLRQHADHVRQVKERKHLMEQQALQQGGGFQGGIGGFPQQQTQMWPGHQGHQGLTGAGMQGHGQGLGQGQPFSEAPPAQYVGGPTSSQYPNLPQQQHGFQQPQHGFQQPQHGLFQPQHGQHGFGQGQQGFSSLPSSLPGFGHQHQGALPGYGQQHGSLQPGYGQQTQGMTGQPQSQYVGGPPSSQYPDIPGSTHQIGSQRSNSPVF